MATILVIEDEAVVLILTESIVMNVGYETLTAGSLSEATSIIDPDATLDLVFTHITLHDDHDAGIKIGKLVEGKRPGVPVLYTSGRELTDGLRSLFVENSDFVGSRTRTLKWWKRSPGWCGRSVVTSTPLTAAGLIRVLTA